MSLETCHLLCCRSVVCGHRPYVECATALAEEVDALICISIYGVAVLASPVGELRMLARSRVIEPNIACDRRCVVLAELILATLAVLI